MIHTEEIKIEWGRRKSKNQAWIHDDDGEMSWQRDEKGRARALHFAKPDMEIEK
jgi:hypothetical protein